MQKKFITFLSAVIKTRNDKQAENIVILTLEAFVDKDIN